MAVISNSSDHQTPRNGLSSLFGGGNEMIHGGARLDGVDGGTAPNLFSLRATSIAGDCSEAGADLDGADSDTLIVHGRARISYDPTSAGNGTIRWSSGDLTTLSTFENIKHTPCFTPGSSIETMGGPIPVERLEPGQKVLTRDNGYQVVRWVGRRDLTAADLAAYPALRPVRIARGALGPDLPSVDLVVSPQHRMLLTSTRAEMFFGETEVLAPALYLLGRPGVTRVEQGAVSYVHVMFDQHQIILADGAWTESFQPGDLSLRGLDRTQRAEIFALFPELAFPDGREAYAAARLSLRAEEVQVMLAA